MEIANHAITYQIKKKSGFVPRVIASAKLSTNISSWTSSAGLLDINTFRLFEGARIQCSTMLHNATSGPTLRLITPELYLLIKQSRM